MSINFLLLLSATSIFKSSNFNFNKFFHLTAQVAGELGSLIDSSAGYSIGGSVKTEFSNVFNQP
ncbi:hypothetical protein [Flavobacterium sp.]|uniref:hypothetical protein n=1 Tax=Flavobacterium sp. TaxID=239 RepID=UPI003D0CD903